MDGNKREHDSFEFKVLSEDVVDGDKALVTFWRSKHRTTVLQRTTLCLPNDVLSQIYSYASKGSLKTEEWSVFVLEKVLCDVF